MLEEGLTASESQLRSPMAEEEDEVEDDASGLLRSPESTERATVMIWSSWTAQGEEGEAVAAVVHGGALGRAQKRKQRRGKRLTESRERGERQRGLWGVSKRVGGASVATRRWPGRCRCSPPSCFGARGRKTTEWRRWAGPASSDGPLGGLERQVSTLSLFSNSVSVFYLF